MRGHILSGLPMILLVAVPFITCAQERVSLEVIELRKGYRVEGEILKETDSELVVDIGIELLRIPKEHIVRRFRRDRKPVADSEQSKNTVYNMSKSLAEKSVSVLADQFGEAVVLVQTPSGLGSGFIINQEGYCITNYHVIEKETRIVVVIFQQTERELIRLRIDNVRIVAMNPFVDLAMLQIPKPENYVFRYVFVAGEDSMQAGDAVFAIGNPLGLERSVSQGIVSMRNRNFSGLTFLQTTTEINPGNSGGPLFNLKGEVVGVTNMKMVYGEGLGFAIPVSYMKHFLNNRDAFAFDRDNPNAGYRYLEAPKRRKAGRPSPVKDKNE